MIKKVNARRKQVNPAQYLEEARLMEKAIRDEASALKHAEREGFAEGFAKAFAKAFTESIKKGERKASIEFAYKLLMSGKMTRQEIIELTELTEEDLQDIMEKNGKTE
ncbi:MAG: hypothetical protein LBF22_03685 [Deltaproteobacteria bacterium]|jgi:flagellar biosynthesis/type III secretory pathway protein FliH|nr:hypothetical protein [Deltaproteobacteria bacterium]